MQSSLAALLLIPIAMFSGRGDKWEVISDNYGDPQVAVDLTSVHKNAGLTVAIIKDRRGDEGYFISDCGELIMTLQPRSMDDLVSQLDNLAQVFGGGYEHVHPNSVGALMVGAMCKKP
jgi:hypothetical protein